MVFAMKILVNQMVAILVAAILCHGLQPTGVTGAAVLTGCCVFVYMVVYSELPHKPRYYANVRNAKLCNFATYDNEQIKDQLSRKKQLNTTLTLRR